MNERVLMAYTALMGNRTDNFTGLRIVHNKSEIEWFAYYKTSPNGYDIETLSVACTEYVANFPDITSVIEHNVPYTFRYDDLDDNWIIYPNEISLRTEIDADDLYLHDGSINSIFYNWNKCEISIDCQGYFEDSRYLFGCKIWFKGVKKFESSHLEPWGQSTYVSSIDFSGNGSCTILMNSGDAIYIEYDDVVVAIESSSP